ncbi:MAG: hypothetical protein LBD67_03260 [Candidatus Accumulibacter sp.]|jgi:hypothetical protein|nr:hypothetical protein [Accumulibacter sp.]
MLKVFGIVVFLVGCAGVYWTGKRSFERRNVAEEEVFEFYRKAVGPKVMEGVISLVANVLVVLGFGMFCIAWVSGV